MDKIEWSIPATQKLIDLYEQFPCMFDTKHKLYHNKHARSDALFKIAEGLAEILPNVTAEEVKKKITNLRSQYSHECAKMKKSAHSGMSQEELYEPSVWWFNRLNFLNCYVKPRKGKSSLELLENQLTDSQEGFESTSSGDITATEVMETPRKKPKIVATPADDSIVSETVHALQQLQHQMKEPSTSSVHQPYGDYVVAELNSIDDEEILADVKHEINNLLYKAKKQFIAKRQAEVVVINNIL